MAVLQNIRVKFGLAISIIIALALLSFIIDPSTLETALASMSSKYDVGKIAGNPVSYVDFQEEVEKQTQIQEMLTNKSVSSDTEQRQIRDAAWQEFVDKYLFIKQAKAAGITVGKKEILSCTSGDNVSPLIAQSPAFTDENGYFSKEAVVNFVQNLDTDQTGRLRLYWNYLQNAVYSQEFYAKYGSLLRYSDIQNKLTKANVITKNNTIVDIDYVSVPFSLTNDSTVVVSDSEAKEYYKSHKKFFKQKENREVEYVVFEVTPSESDYVAANNAVSEVYEEFKSTDNMKAFLLKNSDRQLMDYWFKKGELSTIDADVDNFVFSSDKGTSDIIRNGKTFYAVRIMSTAQVPDSVFVKHILVQGDNAKAKADSLLKVIDGGAKFSEVAMLNSADKNSAAEGEYGAIGWMTQSYMIPGFESTITATLNKAYRVESQYGSHVVVVTKRTTPVTKKKVAILEKETLASKETFNNYYARANNFSVITAGTCEGYKKALDSLGIYSQPINVAEGTSTYGAIEQAKEVTRWVFDNKPGKASGIITVNNNYFFIVAVNKAHKEGIAKFEEVKDGIKQLLLTKKLAEKQIADFAKKSEGCKSLEEIAAAFNTEVFSDKGVSCAANNAKPYDPTLLGAAAFATVGKVYGPLQGMMGGYYYCVTNKSNETFFTEEDAEVQDAQRVQYNMQALLPVMMEEADVVDHRERFY